jgi:hypothetical protein
LGLAKKRNRLRTADIPGVNVFKKLLRDNSRRLGFNVTSTFAL